MFVWPLSDDDETLHAKSTLDMNDFKQKKKIMIFLIFFPFQFLVVDFFPPIFCHLKKKIFCVFWEALRPTTILRVK